MRDILIEVKNISGMALNYTTPTNFRLRKRFLLGYVLEELSRNLDGSVEWKKVNSKIIQFSLNEVWKSLKET